MALTQIDPLQYTHSRRSKISINDTVSSILTIMIGRHYFRLCDKRPCLRASHIHSHLVTAKVIGEVIQCWLSIISTWRSELIIIKKPVKFASKRECETEFYSVHNDSVTSTGTAEPFVYLKQYAHSSHYIYSRTLRSRLQSFPFTPVRRVYGVRRVH